MMRSDVIEMENSVDRLLLYLAVGYGVFAGLTLILSTLHTEYDIVPSYAYFFSAVALIP